jgi:hypothetical protein
MRNDHHLEHYQTLLHEFSLRIACHHRLLLFFLMALNTSKEKDTSLPAIRSMELTSPSAESDIQCQSGNFTPAEEKRLVRKLDWRILPLTSLLYLFAYLDRSNLGNAVSPTTANFAEYSRRLTPQ